MIIILSIVTTNGFSLTRAIWGSLNHYCYFLNSIICVFVMLIAMIMLLCFFFVLLFWGWGGGGVGILSKS